MNILFASSIAAWGGGENWMLSAALGMRDRGHAVDLAARAGSALAARAAAAGLPVHAIAFHGDFDPPAAWRFYRLCRRLRCDVLCLNMDRVLRVAGPAARLAGVKAVVPRRGSEFGIGGKLSHRWTYRAVADGIIANSEATRRTMLASAPWLPPERVRLIYNGVHLDQCDVPARRDAVRAALGAPPGAPVIGMIGELTGRKNHAHLVRQLPALRRRFPDVQVWIAGEGPERGALLDLAAKLDAAPALRLLGFRDDIPDLIAGMDLFVHLARQEGFGYAIVEAMAAGKPVVAAAASNIPEIVADGLTGHLCPLDDDAALQDAIARVLSDPAHARELGEAGRARARALFSFERMIAELEDYFAELAARRRRAPERIGPPAA